MVLNSCVREESDKCGFNENIIRKYVIYAMEYWGLAILFLKELSPMGNVIFS